MSKRKSYRPGIASADPLARLAPAPAAERALIVGRFRSSLMTLESGGDPGEQEWRDLADAVNTVETLVNPMGLLDAEATMPAVDAATQAMRRAAARHLAGKRMGLDGVGINAMREVIDVFDQCAAGFTRYVMGRARTLTQERYRKALAGQLPELEVIDL